MMNKMIRSTFFTVVILEAFKPVEVTESNVNYDDLFSDDTRKQKVATELFKQLIKIQQELIKS